MKVTCTKGLDASWKWTVLLEPSWNISFMPSSTIGQTTCSFHLKAMLGCHKFEGDVRKGK